MRLEGGEKTPGANLTTNSERILKVDLALQVLPNIYLRTTSVSDSLSIRILNADSGSVGNGFSSSSHRNVHAGIPGAASGASVSRNAFFVAKKLLSQLIDILLEKCGSSKKGVIDR